MNRLLWALLQKVFCRGVDGESEEEVESEETETEEEETETEEESEEETETEEEVVTEKTESRAQKEIRTLRERSQTAENDAKIAREELAVARQQTTQNAQPNEAQKLFEEEEKALKDPNIEPWQRYAIQGNRNARAAEANSQQALQEARDLKDQAEFERVTAANPKTVERYKDKVEEIRAKNPNAPRKAVLAMLVGQDMLDGKLKSEPKPTKTVGSAARGKLPGARSDTRSSGPAKGDSIEAIEKRLSGVRI